MNLRNLLFNDFHLINLLILLSFCISYSPFRFKNIQHPPCHPVAFSSRYRNTGRVDKVYTMKLKELESNLNEMSTIDALKYVVRELNISTHDLFENVEKLQNSPTINTYIIANPKVFLSKSHISKFYTDFDFSVETITVQKLLSILPVIYIAEQHPEYGILGYNLNRPSGKLVADSLPSLKYLRSIPIYTGGFQQKGNSLTMLHQRQGFTDNRSFKFLPKRTDFRLYFSPDFAMANELVSTGDAKVKEFKFFQYATVWAPQQLELEYDSKLWITLSAPASVIFDNDFKFPLWGKLVKSLAKF